MEAENSGESERREVWYSGRVQGVGFRYTARRIASQFRVAGWVRNLPDGRVHLVAEGEATEIDRFLTEVSDELRRYIEGCEQRRGPATHQSIEFEVRH